MFYRVNVRIFPVLLIKYDFKAAGAGPAITVPEIEYIEP